MKKKLTCLVATLALGALLLSGCGKSAGDSKTFTVGFDAEYPPYGYMDENGEYTGFDLELAQAVCDLEGWTLVKQPIVWDNKDNELNSGSIDCIWNGFTMDGREDDYAWSDPYVDNSQVIVTSADSGITKLSDYNTAFAELEAGSVDAIAMDIGVAQYQIDSRNNGSFIILDEHLNSEQYGIGFALNNTDLRDTVNKDLHTLKENGTFDELAEKYGLTDMVCLD